MSPSPIPSNDDASASAAAAAASAASTSTAVDEVTSHDQPGIEGVSMSPEEVAAAAEVTASPPRPAATAAEMGYGA
jgi:hypothetical protein